MICDFPVDSGTMSVRAQDITRIKTRTGRDKEGNDTGLFEGAHVFLADGTQFHTTLEQDAARSVWLSGLMSLMALSDAREFTDPDE